MKAVMISIRPNWCEMIASGKKIVEVRKTKPKLDPPFKCYIYCTKKHIDDGNGDLVFYGFDKEPGKECTIAASCAGTVIGEFICDAVLPISVTYSDENSRVALREFPYTGMTDKDIIDYLGNGKPGYGWHISDLEIYDKPKNLTAFRSFYPSVEWEDGYPMPTHEIKRPPQSWFYVDAL